MFCPCYHSISHRAQQKQEIVNLSLTYQSINEDSFSSLKSLSRIHYHHCRVPNVFSTIVSSFLVVWQAKTSHSSFPSSLNPQMILIFEWKESVRGVHHFPVKEGSVLSAPLSCINHTPTVAAVFILMKERDINCWHSQNWWTVFLWHISLPIVMESFIFVISTPS